MGIAAPTPELPEAMAPPQVKVQQQMGGGLSQQSDLTNAQKYADKFRSQVESESGKKFDKWEVVYHSSRSTNPPYHGVKVSTGNEGEWAMSLSGFDLEIMTMSCNNQVKIIS